MLLALEVDSTELEVQLGNLIVALEYVVVELLEVIFQEGQLHLILFKLLLVVGGFVLGPIDETTLLIKHPLDPLILLPKILQLTKVLPHLPGIFLEAADLILQLPYPELLISGVLPDFVEHILFFLQHGLKA